jgi:DNA invertase Pin-like site-specific DNA recombinase
MNGNGMAAQRKAVENYLNGGRWKLVGKFTEVESGKRRDRPELRQSLSLRSWTGFPATSISSAA